MILVTWHSTTTFNGETIQEGTGIFLAPVKSEHGFTSLIIIPLGSDQAIEVPLASVRFPDLLEGRKHIKRTIKGLQKPKKDTEKT